MALSEQEQRLLDQLEQALAADDPKLANALRGTGVRRLQRSRALLAGLGLIVGLAALVAGMQTVPVVSVVGFLIMLASSILFLSSWKPITGEPTAGTAPRTNAPDTAFLDRLEERWRRQHEDGA